MRAKAPVETRGIDFSLELEVQSAVSHWKWILRTDLRSSPRAAHTLIHRALCPAYTDFNLLKPWAWGNSIISRKK